MRKALRQSIRLRDDFRCRYCGLSETDVGSALTLDHVQPRSQGGDDSPENLVYCCHPCNEFKGEYWQTAPPFRLLHPLLDTGAEHYQEQEDGTLLALTERGANPINVLHLNREGLVAHRLRNRFYAAQAAYYRTVDTHMMEMEAELEELRRLLNRSF